MKLITQISLSSETGIPVATINQLISRGVLPRPNQRVGRHGYYTEEAALVVLEWLRVQYRPYTRYEAGLVRFPEGIKEEA